MSRTVRIISFVLSLFCLATIIYLSLSRDVFIPQYIMGEDKGAHFLAYMALTININDFSGSHMISHSCIFCII